MTGVFATYYVGNARRVLSKLADASADLVLSSPPFLAQRNYLPDEDPDKSLELGTEASVGEYIDHLLDVVEECARVLTPHGTLAFELGDSYAGSGGAGGDYAPGGWREGQPEFAGTARRKWERVDDGRGHPVPNRDDKRQPGGPGWPLDKSLCLVPEIFRFALVWGFNPLTGRETEQWRGRNVVRWVRPNPPPGALGDKFRPGTTELVVACKARDRYFDLEAVRASVSDWTQRYTEKPMPLSKRAETSEQQGDNVRRNMAGETLNPHGAPPLDWWLITTEPYEGAHYATWPSRLCETPIAAMSPQRVCRTCGQPSRRVLKTETPTGESLWDHEPDGRRRTSSTRIPGDGPGTSSRAETLGWTDCGHDDWRPGIVLDPFAGSGTTLAVAAGYGRAAIGIDLDPRNVELARERVGPLLFEVGQI